jgi:hypothetical protein
VAATPAPAPAPTATPPPAPVSSATTHTVWTSHDSSRSDADRDA